MNNMEERDFVYWLNGFFELSGATTLNEQQVKVIKEHLALVMTKVTPTTIPPTILPNSPLLPKGWEITCQTTDVVTEKSVTFGGVKCKSCAELTSNEGGTCYRCQNSNALKVSSDSLFENNSVVNLPTVLTC
jgi:hypothetical protein